MKPYFFSLVVFTLLIVTSSFAQQKVKAKDDKAKVKTENTPMKMEEMKMKVLPPLDTLIIERVMGIKGKANNGEYKVTIPQNDLSIDVDGFKIIPAMGL